MDHRLKSVMKNMRTIFSSPMILKTKYGKENGILPKSLNSLKGIRQALFFLLKYHGVNFSSKLVFRNSSKD